MSHRKQFGLHKPASPVTIRTTGGDQPNFVVMIDRINLGGFKTKPFENVTGLLFNVDRTKNQMQIIVAVNSATNNVCDEKFRNLIGKLNAENCGLSLKDVDLIINRFNEFLKENKIKSKYTHNPMHDSGTFRPSNNKAF